jgi:plasmid stabilization system protein ParE
MPARELIVVLASQAQDDVRNALLYTSRQWGLPRAVAYQGKLNEAFASLSATHTLGDRETTSHQAFGVSSSAHTRSSTVSTPTRCGYFVSCMSDDPLSASVIERSGVVRTPERMLR